MKMNRFRKAALSLVAASMAGQFLPSAAVMTIAANEVQAQNNNQMTSPEQTVYFNKVSADDRLANFNANWKFVLGDSKNAQNPGYDDSKWDLLNLPHDYSIDQDYQSSMEAESGYKAGGTGWYRKSFTLDEACKDKRIVIQFNGVYMNASVYINGVKLGEHPYGYTGFAFDLTDYIDYEGENVIAVKVDHQTPSSRWYSGSGIYRDVYISVLEDVHVDYNGVFVTTPDLENELKNGGNVTTAVSTDVENSSKEAKEVTVRQTVSFKGEKVASAESTVKVAAGETKTVDTNVMVNNPSLWDLNTPNLYVLTTEIVEGEEVVDTVETEFGYRYFAFDANTGFSLNGKNVKLKGVCMHHDQGSLGAAAEDDAIARQVRILKEMGCNAIRVTHNPADEALLQEASRQGMLIINELFDGWTEAKNGNYNDYGKWFDVTVDEDNLILGKEDGDTWAEYDTRSTIKSSRNEASVIMYSICNEVQEGTGGNTGHYPQIAQNIIDWIEESDATRVITNGSNWLKNGNGVATQIANILDAAGGAVGGNYTSGSKYDEWHANNPGWIIYGAETASAINSRGIYDRISGGSQTADQQLTSYDNSAVGWGKVASDAWYETIVRDFVAGEFVWTGFDYLGEPTPWNGTGSGSTTNNFEVAPKNSYFGIIDTAGLPKDTYYLYQSLWNDDVNTLHVLPAWNDGVVYKDSKGNVPVVVYSDAAAVELFFIDANGNEKSLGKKEFTQFTTEAGYTYQLYQGEDKNAAEHKNMYLTWNVPYADGTVKAVAYDKNGNIIEDTEGRSFVTTAGEAASLNVSIDRTEVDANGTDLIYAEIDVVDANGTIVPDADNRITVTVEGGELAGLDNGSSPDHQSFRDDNRKAHAGKLVAIIRADKTAGDIKITATAEGLETAVVTAKAAAVEGEESEDYVGMRYSKTYYVKTGNKPVLPLSVEGVKSNGETDELPVVWEEITDEMVAEVGTFTVTGIADGKTVSVTINVIDEIGSVMNYSGGCMIGSTPELPRTRPAVMADGTIMDTEFEVEWMMPQADGFDEEGIVIIKGTAMVFGDEEEVTASIRVGKGTPVLGDNVAPMAYLSQSIPQELWSDNLDAIIDGSTAVGGEPTRWSNYNYSFNTPENNTNYIDFRYDTQQLLGQMTVYFAKDGWSGYYPDANSTWFEVSEDGENFTRVEAVETIGEEQGSVKAYTYDFDAVTATYVRLHVVNASSNGGKHPTSGKNVCTMITEVELTTVVEKFFLNDTAELESMTIGGYAVSDEALASKTITTSVQNPVVEAVAKDNGSVTVLPVFEDAIRVLVRSEDESTTETYTINFVEPGASDDTRDIPVSALTATAGSFQPNNATEGDPAYALDGKTSTMWHSNWNGAAREDLWIELASADGSDMHVEGLRYLPRSGSWPNGRIVEYRVEAKAADGTYYTVASGSWDNDAEWKWVQFDEAIETSAVRLYCEKASSDSDGTLYASALEVRLMGHADVPVTPEDPETPVTPVDPADDSRDIDVTKQLAAAGSFQTGHATQGGADFAIDGDTNTMWHSSWNGAEREDLWIELSAPEGSMMTVDGVRYLPRNDQWANGIITKYEVKALIDGEWESVAAGDWTTDYEWKLASFDAIETSAVRLYAVESTSDTALSFASAVEFRLTGSIYEVEAEIVDKEELEEVFDKYSDLELSDFEEGEALENFKRALFRARTVLEDEDATAEEVAQALAELKAAREALKEKAPVVSANKTLLQQAVDYADEIVEAGGLEGVNSIVVKQFNEKLAAAKDVLGDTEADQAAVDKAWKELSSAIQMLDFKTDKSDLEALVKECEAINLDLYEEAGKDEFKAALANAKKVLADDTALTDQSILAAINALTAAREALVEIVEDVVNKDDLKDLIDHCAKAINEDLYEKNEAWDAYLKALEAAKVILADENADQAAVDAAKDALSKALVNLVEKEELEVEIVYRAYNPNDGDHLYTTNAFEHKNAVDAGWNDEGIAWVAPKESAIAVYRVYDKNSGEHHYTTDEAEVRALISVHGWKYEGISWYSDVKQTVDVYRAYNPNAKGAGRHHWTTSEYEFNFLISQGWMDENVGFHAVAAK